MSFKDEIIKIQNDNKKRIDTAFVKHAIELIDRDLKLHAKSNPESTEYSYRIQGFEFHVFDGDNAGPGELGYIKVPNSYFGAIEKHYEAEGFEVEGSYDRTMGNGKFVIRWK